MRASPGCVPLAGSHCSPLLCLITAELSSSRSANLEQTAAARDQTEQEAIAKQEEKKQEGEGRLVVGVSPCRFPQSQQIFSLTRPFNYSRVFISWRWPDSEWSLAGSG